MPACWSSYPTRDEAGLELALSPQNQPRLIILKPIWSFGAIPSHLGRRNEKHLKSGS